MSPDDPHVCMIDVRRKRGNVGMRMEAKNVITGEWVEVIPLTKFPEEVTGDLHVEIGHLRRLAPEGLNTRVIFEEMPGGDG